MWDFFDSYPKAEVALSRTECDRIEKSVKLKHQIRILAVLGNGEGLNLESDKLALKNLDSETVFLVKPTSAEFNQCLRDELGWDILCYSGHSSSTADGSDGWINIKDTEQIKISEIETGLKAAIANGLQLAIFNSCDGLGFARQLANLHIPQIIVMREKVHDKVAQKFLNDFLAAFTNGKSLYVSVRQAREKLKELNPTEYPCADWLPALWQNQA